MRTLKSLLLTSLITLMGATSVDAQQSQPVELWGNIIHHTAWDPNPFGIYKFNATDNIQYTTLIKESHVKMNGGGAYINDTLRYVNWEPIQNEPTPFYYEYNTKTWQPTGNYGKDVRALGKSIIARCTAFDPVGRLTYGIFNNAAGTGNELATIDYRTMERKLIKVLSKNLSEEYYAVAIDNHGDLYAINGNGDLVTLDKQTGTSTLVGPTGLGEVAFMQSAAFDLSTNRLYWAAMTNGGQDGLYEVNTKSGAATLIGTLPGEAEILCLYVPETSVGTSPQHPHDLKVNFPGGTLQGTVTFTIPTRTRYGNAIAGGVEYALLDGETALTGARKAPGTAVEIPLELTQGMHTLTLTQASDAGAGAPTIVEVWIGKDTPAQPASLKLDITGKHATLTWSPVKIGVHDGYIDASAVTYDVVRYPDGVTVATDLKATTFSEDLEPEGLVCYSYGLVAKADGASSEEKRSNEVVAADCLELPYFEDFKDEKVLSAYPVADNNQDGRSWSYYRAQHCVRYNYSTANVADDYLLTPYLTLSNEMEYDFTFSVRVHDSKYTEAMEVLVGQGDRLSNYQVVKSKESYNHTTWQKRRAAVRVKESGRYRVALHCVSPKGDYYLYVDSLQMTPGILLTTPKEASDLQARVNFNETANAFSVTLSGIAPAVNQNDQPLLSLSKVEVYAGEVLLTTLTDITPGQAFEVVDNEPKPNDVTYSVVGYNADGKGSTASVTTFVGHDIPMAPANILLQDRFNGTGRLAWDSIATVGRRGGYVNPKKVNYNIYRVSGSNAIFFRGGVQDTCYNQISLPITGSQSLERYAVTAVSQAGESEYGISEGLIIGAPYTLPFHENFANYQTLNDFWLIKRINNDRGWQNTTYSSSDGDMGCIRFYPTAAGQVTYLYTGKLDIENANHPMLYYSYMFTPKMHSKMDIVVAIDGDLENPVTLRQIDSDTIDGAEHWVADVVDLQSVRGHHYVSVGFRGIGGSYGGVIYVDDITVRNVRDHDLSVSIATTGVGKVYSSQTIPVVATLRNNGSMSLDGSRYTVELHDATGVIATCDGHSLDINQQDTVMFYVPTPVTLEGKKELWITAEYPNDDDPFNNTSEKMAITIVPSELPKPTGFGVTPTEEGNVLTWQEPEVGLSHTVVETFEDYVADRLYGDGGQMGEWLMYDADKGQTFDFDKEGLNWFHNGVPFAWALINTNEVWDSFYGQNYRHSGEKVIACFGALPYSCKDLHNDDWLISPELSGLAQTITLWHRPFKYELPMYPAEVFEVLYSTTGRNREDFTVAATITSTELNMTQASIALPVGARYFAIRDITQGGSILLIDDIQYEAKPYTLTGYNIYREGEHTFATTELRYVDKPAEAGIYGYCVTATYVEGESLPTETRTNGIETQRRDDANAAVRYDLTGRRLSPTVQPSGLYIEGGRKMMRP